MQPEPRGTVRAMARGATLRCPACGDGRLFRAYLKVADRCDRCGEDLHHQRADDAPPYLAIFLVGHIVVPLVLAVELAYAPALWIHFAIWMPLVLVLCLLFLPLLKGAVVGLQWAARMHGFGGIDEEAAARGEQALR